MTENENKDVGLEDAPISSEQLPEELTEAKAQEQADVPLKRATSTKRASFFIGDEANAVPVKVEFSLSMNLIRKN